MLKKTITYTDYDGTSRTEDFYFNLTKAEIFEMELMQDGGMATLLQKIISASNVPQIVDIFKKILLKAYGEKSDDGRRFMKSEAISAAFAATEAYSILFMELAVDAQVAADFINAVVPNMAPAELAPALSSAT